MYYNIVNTGCARGARGETPQQNKEGKERQKIVRKISLDFQRRNNVRLIYATQSDMNCRVIVIHLYNDGERYPIHTGSAIVPAINVLRPDGKSSSFPAKITGIGEVTYEMTSWPVGIAGDVQMSLSLYTGDGDRLSTDPFIVHVAEGLYLGSQVEEDEENQTAFANMMQHLASFNLQEDLRVSSENTRDENEHERKRAETLRISKENARITAEADRTTWEAKRYNSETERKANEEIRIANENLRCQVTDALLVGLDNLLAIQAQYLSTAGGVL